MVTPVSYTHLLAAYGEASDVYEGDTLHSYTWYADDDYFKNCRIELDAETQKVSLSLIHILLLW